MVTPSGPNGAASPFSDPVFGVLPGVSRSLSEERTDEADSNDTAEGDVERAIEDDCLRNIRGKP
jgi:hypothetical protein